MNWATAHAGFGVALIIGALIWLVYIIAKPSARPYDLFDVLGVSAIIVIVAIVVGSATGLIFA